MPRRKTIRDIENQRRRILFNPTRGRGYEEQIARSNRVNAIANRYQRNALRSMGYNVPTDTTGLREANIRGVADTSVSRRVYMGLNNG